MTKQEILNIVAEHLLTQNKRSILNKPFECAYRGSDGLKCAVGVLITDSEYTKSMEKKTVEIILRNYPAVAKRIGKENKDILTSLQRLHDFSDPWDWHEELRGITKRYRLKLPSCLRKKKAKESA